jgi:hypothetical protein
MLASNLVHVGKMELGERRGVTPGNPTEKQAFGSVLLEIG